MADDEEYEQDYEHFEDDHDGGISQKNQSVSSHMPAANGRQRISSQHHGSNAPERRSEQGSVKKQRTITPNRTNLITGYALNGSTIVGNGGSSYSMSKVSSRIGIVHKSQQPPVYEKIYEKKLESLLREDEDPSRLSNKQLIDQSAALRQHLRDLNKEITQRIDARKLAIQKLAVADEKQKSASDKASRKGLAHGKGASGSSTSRDDQLRALIAELENARKEQKRLEAEVPKLRARADRYTRPQYYFELVHQIDAIKAEIDAEQKTTKATKVQAHLNGKGLVGLAGGASASSHAERVAASDKSAKAQDLESELFNVTRKNRTHRERMGEIDREMATIAQKTDSVAQRLRDVAEQAQRLGIQDAMLNQILSEGSRMIGDDESAARYKELHARHDAAKKWIDQVKHSNDAKSGLIVRQNERLQRDIAYLDATVNRIDLEILEVKQRIAQQSRGVLVPHVGSAGGPQSDAESLVR